MDSDSSYPTVKFIQVDAIHECEDALDTTVSMPFVVPSDFDGIKSATIEIHSNEHGMLCWSSTAFINEYKELMWDRLAKQTKTPITERRNKLDIRESLKGIVADDFVVFVFTRWGTSIYDTIQASIATLRLNLFYYSSPTTVREPETTPDATEGKECGQQGG